MPILTQGDLLWRKLLHLSQLLQCVLQAVLRSRIRLHRNLIEIMNLTAQIVQFSAAELTCPSVYFHPPTSIFYTPFNIEAVLPPHQPLSPFSSTSCSLAPYNMQTVFPPVPSSPIYQPLTPTLPHTNGDHTPHSPPPPNPVHFHPLTNRPKTLWLHVSPYLKVVRVSPYSSKVLVVK